MPYIDPDKLDQLLKLIASGVKQHLATGDAKQFAVPVIDWMKQNAPSYLE
jgi:hypothetical protein